MPLTLGDRAIDLHRTTRSNRNVVAGALNWVVRSGAIKRAVAITCVASLGLVAEFAIHQLTRAAWQVHLNWWCCSTLRTNLISGSLPMGLTYFKRFQMQTPLRFFSAGFPILPTGYRVAAWDPELLEAHTECKYQSFCGEIDASVFPCLGQLEGCDRLMREISTREGFLPNATWLAKYVSLDGAVEPCGTIQSLRTTGDHGSIQNIGVVPRHRGLGIGSTLLLLALKGFQELGIRYANLEVTAENVDAVRLYQRYGFRTVRTVYKAVEVAYS